MRKIAFLLSILIVAASCSSVKISSDFDSPAGFASYKTYKFTDEATVVEAFGMKVSLVEGEERNIKITRPVDLLLAEQLLAEA